MLKHQVQLLLLGLLLDHVVGDSDLFINLLNGYYSANTKLYDLIMELNHNIFEAWKILDIRTRTTISSLGSHVFRRFNTIADALATIGVISGKGAIHMLRSWPSSVPIRYVEIHFDGGHREGRTGYGWTLRAAAEYNFCSCQPQWIDIVRANGHIDCFDRSCSNAAELMALNQGLLAMFSFIADGHIQLTPSGRVVPAIPFRHFLQFDGIAHF